MTRRFLLATLLSGVAALSLDSGAAVADDPTVVVLAAASLTESLPKVATAWTATGHPKVTFSFDASSILCGTWVRLMNTAFGFASTKGWTLK